MSHLHSATLYLVGKNTVGIPGFSKLIDSNNLFSFSELYLEGSPDPETNSENANLDFLSIS